MSLIARRVGDPPLERREARLRGLRPGSFVPRGLLALAIAVAAVLLGATSAAAQFRIDLAPGAEVRIATAAAPELPVRGRVVRSDDNGTTVVIWARGTPPGTETGYAVRDLASLEVRAGRNRARGALIGAGIATAGAAVFGGFDNARGKISSGELAGTVVSNAVAGALLGALFAPRGWRRLPLPGRS